MTRLVVALVLPVLALATSYVAVKPIAVSIAASLQRTAELITMATEGKLHDALV